jgi:hypothetical protein
MEFAEFHDIPCKEFRISLLLWSDIVPDRIIRAQEASSTHLSEFEKK